MGIPGTINIEITTVFDPEKNLVTRTIRYVSGHGLNALSASQLGTGEFWEIDRDIVSDTIDLPDGEHKLCRAHVGPGQFDYMWRPTDDDTGMGKVYHREVK